MVPRPFLRVSRRSFPRTIDIQLPFCHLYQKPVVQKSSFRHPGTRCWYFLFSLFSCSLKIVDVGLFWLHLELTCVTRTSKNAVTFSEQNPPALMFNLVSGLVIAFLDQTFPYRVERGSALTFLQTLLISEVNRLRVPSCLWVTKTPFYRKRRG